MIAQQMPNAGRLPWQGIDVRRSVLGLFAAILLAGCAGPGAIRMSETPRQVNLAGDTDAVAAWIWKNLVPRSGQADTVQGELLRAVEKLRWEAQNNGNGNWDEGFDKLLGFLRSTLASERRLPAPMLDSVQRDLDTLANFDQPYLEDDLYTRLTGAVVAYCRLNPALIAKANDPGLHR